MIWKDRLGRLAALLTLSMTASAIVLQAQEPPTQTMAVAVDSLLADATLVLRVDGMSCPFCAYGLEKKLNELQAVDTLVVRVSDGAVAIRLRQGQEISDSVLHELAAPR